MYESFLSVEQYHIILCVTVVTSTYSDIQSTIPSSSCTGCDRPVTQGKAACDSFLSYVICTSSIILYHGCKLYNYLLYVVQSLAEREKAVTYKVLMQHLRCGAEIEALFSAQQATSFLPAQSKCSFSVCVCILEAGAVMKVT